MLRYLPVFVLLLPARAGGAAADSLPSLPAAGLVQMLLGLALVLGLILGSAWLLRRYVPRPRGGGALCLRGGVAVGTRERVVLVEVEGVRLVLGVSPGRVQTLHVLGPECDGVPGQDFRRQLAATTAGETHVER